MKKVFVLFICLVMTISLAGSACAMYYDPYSAGSGYGYGYGSMSGYPSYGTGSLDGYTLDTSGAGYYSPSAPGSGYYPATAPASEYYSAPASGYYPSTAPGTGSYIARYTITYMPGTGVSGTPFSTEWYPGDAIISGQGFSRPEHTQTGWSFYDGGPKAFALGQHITISSNMVLYPYWERVSTALYLTVNYSGYGAVRLSGGNVPNGWTGKLEPGQSFNFIFQPYEGYYVYSIFLAGWYRNVQYGNQFMVTYDMLQGQNQTMTVRFESIYRSPKTGDDSNVALWAILALLAGLAACVTAYRLRKDTDRRQDIGAVRHIVTLITMIILLFSGLASMLMPVQFSKAKSQYYFEEAFPLVVKGDDYLKDMVFVEPQNSDLFEVYGYSEAERLLVLLTKGDHNIQYYPDTEKDLFEILAQTSSNMDDFLLAWAQGEWSPY